MDLAKVLGDCIEWAEATCDKDFTVDEFFDMVDIPLEHRSDFVYAAMLSQLEKSGFFQEKEMKPTPKLVIRANRRKMANLSDIIDKTRRFFNEG